MNARRFLAVVGKGIGLAERKANDNWSVEFLLEDQQVNCLAADPHNPNVVFAGTQGNGLLRSEDCGQTWQPGGMAGEVIKSIAFSRSEAGVMYVGTKPPAVFVSRDGGQNWSELESFRPMRRNHWFTPAEPGDPYVLGLAVSPTDPKNIIAGVEYGAVLRSTDGGQTWQGHLKNTSRDCHALKFHDTDGNWVYQAGGGWPAAVSRDGGATWRQPRGGLGMSFYAIACAADPQRPDILGIYPPHPWLCSPNYRCSRACTGRDTPTLSCFARPRRAAGNGWAAACLVRWITRLMPCSPTRLRRDMFTPGWPMAMSGIPPIMAMPGSSFPLI